MEYNRGKKRKLVQLDDYLYRQYGIITLVEEEMLEKIKIPDNIQYEILIKMYFLKYSATLYCWTFPINEFYKGENIRKNYVTFKKKRYTK